MWAFSTLFQSEAEFHCIETLFLRKEGFITRFYYDVDGNGDNVGN